MLPHFGQQNGFQTPALNADNTRRNPNRPPEILPSQPTPSYTLPKTGEITRAKRTRAKRSCDLCRKKKTRCNSDLFRPCTTCRSAGIECQFLVDQKKRGPSASYVETLEKRLELMEGIIRDLSGKKKDCKIGATLIHESEDEDDSDEEDVSNTCFRPHDDSLDESAQLSRQLNDLNLTDYERTHYIGASAGVHMMGEELFQSNARHRVRQDQPWIVQKVNDDEDEHVIIKSEEIQEHRYLDQQPSQGPLFDIIQNTPYMTQELADSLIEIYFKNIHPFCPILNKIGFLEQYYYSNPCPPDKYLLCAVLAISTRFLPHGSDFGMTVDEMLTMQASLRAKAEKLLEVLFKRSRISTIQSLMLLSWFVDSAKDDAEDTTHWFTSGMAIRMAQDLGLHRNSSRWRIPEHEVELRRRIWFCVYEMDKWVSAELGRPLTILDDEFDVELPSAYEIGSTHRTPYSENTPQLIKEADEAIKNKTPIYECFTYMMTLAQILGQVLLALHTPKTRRAAARNVKLAKAIDKRLYNWKMNLPPAFKLESGPNASKPGAGLMDIAYSCTLLLLHRPFINNHDPENIDLAFQSLSNCTAAANGIITAAEELESEGFLCMPWSMTPYAIFQAGVIFLFNAKSDNPHIREQGVKNLLRCAQAFRRDPNVNGSRISQVLSSVSARFSLPMDQDDETQKTDQTPADNSEAQQPMPMENSPASGHSATTASPAPMPFYYTETPSPRSAHSPQTHQPPTTTLQPPEPMFTSSTADVSFPVPSQASLSTRPEDMFLISLSRGMGKHLDSAPSTPSPGRTTAPCSPNDLVQDFSQVPENTMANDGYAAYDTMTDNRGLDLGLVGQQPTITSQSAPSNTAITSPPLNIPTYTLHTGEQMQFDLSDLMSEVPIWNVPNGITWAEWDAYLQSNR